jgi:hypothetical protein
MLALAVGRKLMAKREKFTATALVTGEKIG